MIKNDLEAYKKKLNSEKKEKSIVSSSQKNKT